MMMQVRAGLKLAEFDPRDERPMYFRNRVVVCLVSRGDGQNTRGTTMERRKVCKVRLENKSRPHHGFLFNKMPHWPVGSLAPCLTHQCATNKSALQLLNLDTAQIGGVWRNLMLMGWV
jgi:hypothetical protein